jgi:hypothetical protein
MRAIKIDVNRQEVYYVEDFLSGIHPFNVEMKYHLNDEWPVVIGQVDNNSIMVANKPDNKSWAFAMNGLPELYHGNAMIVGLDENFRCTDTTITIDDIYVAFISNRFEVKPSKILEYED